ncbi:hypothetical protein E4U32_007196 [Claviceps aff. humidiphila group G2b]|nr:hypothetical protein E4U32_007196 [Claviceps aff. humidiphila group G2b]
MDSSEYDNEIPQLVNVVVAVMRVTHLKESKLFATRNYTMNWNEIASHLPGRTAEACRRYYRQMQSRCDTWTLERQNTLCKVYESLEVEMWTKIGGKASVPWQFAKQMYWRHGPWPMVPKWQSTRPIEFVLNLRIRIFLRV